MPALIAPILVLIGFVREVYHLFSKQQYRALLGWVAILLLVGTIFYNNVEGWGWLDSLYFCVVTLATVGYGDLTPTTELGKGFAIVYILLGLGMIATFASMLAKERMAMIDDRHDDHNMNNERAA
jgi:voltage-gated potassium channel